MTEQKQSQQHDSKQPKPDTKSKRSVQAEGRPDPGDEGDGNKIFEAQEEWREQQKRLEEERIQENAEQGR